MNYLWIIFAAITGLFYYNTFAWLAGSWLQNEYYSHGFLVPIISGYLIWSMRKELAGIEKKQSRYGLAIFTAGIILHGIGVMWSIRFLSGISLILAISGVILYIYGWAIMRRVAFPVLFLFLMIPLPFVDIIAPPAQSISAYASANIANIIGIPVQMEGLILHIPSGSFEVGLPCSGMNSMISLFTIAAILAFLLDGSMWMKVTILASSLPLALAGNILRIVSVLAVANTYGQEAAMNYFHDLSSLLLFGVALSGLFLVGRCFGRLRFKRIL